MPNQTKNTFGNSDDMALILSTKMVIQDVEFKSLSSSKRFPKRFNLPNNLVANQLLIPVVIFNNESDSAGNPTQSG